MSWSFEVRCLDEGLDVTLRATVKAQTARLDNPASARALDRVLEHGLGALHFAPKGSTLRVTSSGHYDSQGQGGHRVEVEIETAAAVAASQYALEQTARRALLHESAALGRPEPEVESPFNADFPTL